MALKHKLETNAGDKPLLFGIITTMEGFRLCHFLNKILGIRFCRLADLQPGNNSTLFFEFYSYVHVHQGYHWYLIANKKGHSLLLPSIKQFDFLLLINETPTGSSADQLVKDIKQISQVQLAQYLNAEQITGLDYLLEDIEMHLIQTKKTDFVDDDE